jgi:hypothetical protein
MENPTLGRGAMSDDVRTLRDAVRSQVEVGSRSILEISGGVRSKSPIVLAAARVRSDRSSLYGSGSGGRPSGYGASGKGPLGTGSIPAPRSRFSFGDDAPVAPAFDATARLPGGGDK